MHYVADTHAFIRYLVGSAPKRVVQIFESSEKGECVIYFPTIVLAEAFYLTKMEKVKLNFNEMLSRIEQCENYVVVPFNMHILKKFLEVNLAEIHDQIIVSTAKYLNCALLTKDEKIKESGEVEVIWG